MSVLIILGSARGESHTLALVNTVVGGRPAKQIDLLESDIHHYEYGQPLERDDFGAIAEAMVAHTRIVLATPVYWYSMSGRMKTLFDRLTDLVTVRKDLGRRLSGRRIYVLACGSEPRVPDGFEVPFRETAAYLAMDYCGMFYARTNKQGLLPSAIPAAEAFGDRIFAVAAGI